MKTARFNVKPHHSFTYPAAACLQIHVDTVQLALNKECRSLSFNGNVAINQSFDTAK